jgi:RHS repeat-associated protein
MPTYYQQDALGSTVLTTNSAGTSSGSYDYDVYGTPRSSTPAFGYTGQQGDNSGLLYLRARSYATNTGRFPVPDPGASVDGLSTPPQAFAYSGNNPTNYRDPSGCSWLDDHRREVASLLGTTAKALQLLHLEVWYPFIHSEPELDINIVNPCHIIVGLCPENVRQTTLRVTSGATPGPAAFEQRNSIIARPSHSTGK